jgi:acyl-CoA thioesterase-2
MFSLEPHGPDTFVGQGPRYPWGGLYGGQIVAQALRAASFTVNTQVEPAHSDQALVSDGLDPESPVQFTPHSIRAYFIRRGDHTEPVRYEVDRIRNGRSFVTRRVVARQATGAILNAECSFQRPEAAEEVQSVQMPEVPPAITLVQDSWTDTFDRCLVPESAIGGESRIGTGRTTAWLRVRHDLGPIEAPANQFLHQCWLAYLSDELPTDSVRRAHPVARTEGEHFFGTSLDHTIWFHRPMRADRWHLHDYTCHHFVGGRGLVLGHVFSDDGLHVATVAQEALLRDRRARG